MNLVKTALLGGLGVLLPILLLWVMMDEILALVVGLATPIADLFPGDTFEGLHFPSLVAIALILVASLLLGLAAQLSPGRRFAAAVERNTLGRLPLYQSLKGLARRMVNAENEASFRPALLRTEGDQLEIVFVIEELSNDRSAILVPWSPTPLAGSVKIVKTETLELLDSKFGDVTRVLSNWGVGSKQLLDEAGVVG